MKNSRICQPQVRGGWIILRVILHVEWRVHSDLFCLVGVELRVHSDRFCLECGELCVHSKLLCLQYAVTMRVPLSYSVNDVCHLFSACSLYHLLHVPPSSGTDFSCFYALKFNHAPCDVSDLPHDAALLWFVVVGDADCVAPTDAIESVVSNIFMKLGIPLLSTLNVPSFVKDFWRICHYIRRKFLFLLHENLIRARKHAL